MPNLGQLKPTFLPIEQSNAEVFFQFFYLMTDRSRCHIQLVCRFSDTLVACDHLECFQSVKMCKMLAHDSEDICLFSYSFKTAQQKEIAAVHKLT